MKLAYLLEKKHLFKQRQKSVLQRAQSPLIGEFSVTFLNRFRFEITYLRSVHRVLRRGFVRRKYLFRRIYYWVLAVPNHILSAHSKNIRMGGGVGLALRICIAIKPGQRFIETRGFSPLWLRRVVSVWRYSWSSNLLIMGRLCLLLIKKKLL